MPWLTPWSTACSASTATFAESRLQLTPVEWGIWTFLILRALDGLDSATATDRATTR